MLVSAVCVGFETVTEPFVLWLDLAEYDGVAWMTKSKEFGDGLWFCPVDETTALEDEGEDIKRGALCSEELSDGMSITGNNLEAGEGDGVEVTEGLREWGGSGERGASGEVGNEGCKFRNGTRRTVDLGLVADVCVDELEELAIEALDVARSGVDTGG